MALTHAVTPDLVHGARRLAHRYLRQNAPTAWAAMIADGTVFYTPQEVAHLGIAELARWLATKEARRLAKARLFHCDLEVTRAAIHAGGVFHDKPYALGPDLLPAQFGMLVWAEDVSASVGESEVIACHWQAQDDGVWTTWWSDTVSFVRTNIAAGVYTDADATIVLEQHGVLMYDRERLLPYGVGVLDAPAPEPELDDRLRALTFTTLATWALLSGGLVSTSVLAARAGKVAGLAPIPGADDSVTMATGPISAPEA